MSLDQRDYNLTVYAFFLEWTEKTVQGQWKTVDEAMESLISLSLRYNIHCAAPNKAEQINIMWNDLYSWLYMLAGNYPALNNDSLNKFERKMKTDMLYYDAIGPKLLKARAGMQTFFDNLWAFRSNNN